MNATDNKVQQAKYPRSTVIDCQRARKRSRPTITEREQLYDAIRKLQNENNELRSTVKFLAKLATIKGD